VIELPKNGQFYALAQKGYDIKEHLNEGGKISPYVANSVELALVIPYCIVSAFVCMV
jgi:hypothetical protein